MNFSLDRDTLVFGCFYAFWIWMIIDCATRETPKASRSAWLLLIALVGCAGAPIYFFSRKVPRKRTQTTLTS